MLAFMADIDFDMINTTMSVVTFFVMSTGRLTIAIKGAVAA